ncbi:thioredoxin [Candidatus Aerophobetes bacterium]|uniref:Thioredoxin n=1 Tax=Aerophobetes bacterium TaxID=2030807 RepID=A0A523UTB2_UNCAE|nr:MAG: thioredoxin [Candidatus Aerophobetes bacterium]
MAEVTLTDQSWDNEVLNSNLPVIVDFWAEWCAPCGMIAQVVEQIGEEYEGKIKVGKLNVDENPLTAGKYQVMAIPTLLLFNGGKLVDRVVGVVPKKILVEKVENILNEEDQS